ncbi:MAG: amidophosphoribosyltransferase, partial [Desulfosudaceae bacterium]
MGGIFGCASTVNCVSDLFYGTDYLSHLGTRRGGMAVWGANGIARKIHSLESSYFRTKFEADLNDLSGNTGIGVISDNEDQPILVRSHLGTFGLVTVSRINNLEELTATELSHRRSFSELSPLGINPTELVAMLICQKGSLEEGIVNAQNSIRGSCSLLLLTENGIYAARDRLGRTPLIIGRRRDAMALSSESCAFPNLGYETDRDIGPGEIIRITPDGFEQLVPPGEAMQICSFLWVYYGYPASRYEGINVEDVRYRCGNALARNDDISIDYAAGIPDSGTGHAVGYANERQ